MTDSDPLPKFSYQPIAPHIAPDHPDQRYFSRGQKNSLSFSVKGALDQLKEHKTSIEVTVMRFKNYKFATLELEALASAYFASLNVACTANELREIAYRLLDAAHDLETHPAKG